MAINKLKLYAVPVLMFFAMTLQPVSGADFYEGRIKLSLDQKTGRFALYYLVDAENNKYQNLLWTKDAKTSYLAVQINNRVYKLGDASYFKADIRGTQTNPVLVFESPVLAVVMDFSFIQTFNSPFVNGIRIDIRMQNWGERDVEAGLKLVLDTYFGEKKTPQFKTDLRYLDSETIINRAVPDKWWLTKDKNGSLMGSIFVDGTYNPETLHFANWKRLAEAKWKLPFVMGRNFNALPFSIKDSAVAYFMETETLARWDQRIMTVMLATEDSGGFGVQTTGLGYVYGLDGKRSLPMQGAGSSAASSAAASGGGQAPVIINNNIPQLGPVQPSKTSLILPTGSLRLDILTLREMIYKIDEAVYFGVDVSEEELRAMEALIARMRSRYGSVFGGIGLYGY